MSNEPGYNQTWVNRYYSGCCPSCDRFNHAVRAVTDRPIAAGYSKWCGLLLYTRSSETGSVNGCRGFERFLWPQVSQVFGPPKDLYSDIYFCRAAAVVW